MGLEGRGFGFVVSRLRVMGLAFEVSPSGFGGFEGFGFGVLEVRGFGFGVLEVRGFLFGFSRFQVQELRGSGFFEVSRFDISRLPFRLLEVRGF